MRGLTYDTTVKDIPEDVDITSTFRSVSWLMAFQEILLHGVFVVMSFSGIKFRYPNSPPKCPMLFETWNDFMVQYVFGLAQTTVSTVFDICISRSKTHISSDGYSQSELNVR